MAKRVKRKSKNKKRFNFRKFIIILTIAIILQILLNLFLIRAFSPREIDDVSPAIPCEKSLLDKADILWVIPNFNRTLISNNRTWCKEILSLNKTLGLHGVTHEYNEFATDKDQIYLERGINVFESCFNQNVTIFKAPQLAINKNNTLLIEDNSIAVEGYFNQITHKVYHCNNEDRIPNWLIDIF